jgi:transaldolase
VHRPNLMIKIPGTDAGTPAIEATIAEGINVNVTLLFAVKAYEDVAQAYIAGLEALAAKGGDVSRVASVASFFLSRIDGVADAKITALKGADPALVEKTLHKVAIANAKRAYQRSKAIFSGPRWEKLAAKGAHPQRLLWASTGTKDKSLPDTYYVDNIIGRDTVNTMPPATMKAFRDHGTAIRDSIESDVAGAEETLAALGKLGISLDEITHELVLDGIKKFEEAFDNLIGGVKKRRSEFSKAA